MLRYGSARTPLKMLLPAALAAAVLAGCESDDDPSSSANGKAHAGEKSIRVEIALASHEARWRPALGNGGRLVLDDVSPRMAVMSAAPQRRIAVLPASMLRANWRPLFGSSGGETNVVLSVDIRGRRALVPLRARLVRGHATGRRFVFAVSPLRHAAHTPDRLPAKAVVLSDPTLLVDPTVTDAIKAMWESLVSFFTGKSFDVPPDPTYTNSDGKSAVFDDGDIYKGPNSAQMTTAEEWAEVQREVLDGAGGQYVDGDWEGNPFGQLTLQGGEYDGLAIFTSPYRFRNIVFSPSGPRVVIENSAIFDVQTDGLRFADADIGGLNMRGTVAPQFSAENTLFKTVDVTGARFGGTLEGPRSSVENSAFVDVRGDRAAETPDGNADRFNDKAVQFQAIDFTSVTFQDVAFPSAVLEDVSFQGCGFQNVDLSGAQIRGADPTRNDGKFQPTFDNSIMEDVKLDNAVLQDVSFAGVDFSGGGISLDGARLNNVDFTGAVGLQFIDWGSVTVEGNVYGLEQYGHEIGDLQSRDYLRSMTFDGEIPKIDADTGFDVDPHTGWLIDTDTGVRLEKGDIGRGLIPIDPATGDPMRDPRTGDPLVFEPGGVFNPETNQRFDVDYATGALEGER